MTSKKKNHQQENTFSFNIFPKIIGIIIVSIGIIEDK